MSESWLDCHDHTHDTSRVYASCLCDVRSSGVQQEVCPTAWPMLMLTWLLAHVRGCAQKGTVGHSCVQHGDACAPGNAVSVLQARCSLARLAAAWLYQGRHCGRLLPPCMCLCCCMHVALLCVPLMVQLGAACSLQLLMCIELCPKLLVQPCRRHGVFGMHTSIILVFLMLMFHSFALSRWGPDGIDARAYIAS